MRNRVFRGIQMNRPQARAQLSEFLVGSIEQARAVEKPFYHLQFDSVFPQDVYDAMIREMPVDRDYRALPGRNNVNILDDGSATRIKIDLFPEYIRNMPAQKRELWDLVGRALCSNEVRDAFVRRLAPALERRFGPDYCNVGMFPIPILTRDVPKYKITRTPTPSGRASRSSSICRRTVRPSTSARSSMTSCRTAACRTPSRCRSCPTPGTPSRSAKTPGTRPIRSGLR